MHMARLTYQAPGVYVEEVPSARQPIAGVGTNTVAFIGIVPDEIYYPVLNPDYDPVAANAALQFDLLRRELAESDDEETKREITGKIEEARKDLEVSRNNLSNQLRHKEDVYNKAVVKRDAALKESDDAQKKLDDLGPPTATEDDKKKAERQTATGNAQTKRAAYERAETDVANKKKALDEQSDELTDIENKLKNEPSSLPENAGPYVEAELADFFGTNPPDDLVKKSVLRPYTLVKFEIKVAPLDTKFCSNFTEYTNRFGPFSAFKTTPEPGSETANPDTWVYKPYYPGHQALTQAVYGFFNNGGTRCFVARVKSESQIKAVLDSIESIDEVAIIAAPGLSKNATVWDQLLSYSESHENVFAILDSPEVVNDGTSNDLYIQGLAAPGTDNVPRTSKNGAYYFPYIEVIDPAKQLQDSDPVRRVGAKYRGRTYVPPSGHMAGIYARTDEERGVHKAPANCVVRGAVDMKYYISKPVQEMLNPQGINAIRTMNGAITVWGARTIGGDRNGEWKYINVRRFFLFLQESIDEGTQWVVFEPNDYALWGKIRLNVTAFLTNVWRSGALFGLTPDEAFYVKCDAELNPPEVRDLGQVITEIGVAIVRPAEFVIFRISQSTGQEKT
jgi:phage tail sheath protein FI